MPQAILRVESGMHAGAITCIAADPGGRYLLTGGMDGTVRIYNLFNHAALAVLRPPIEKGEVPAITAVALSRDARLVAVAAATASRGVLYLFERATAKLRGRVEIPGITSLVFSHDGARLAATTAGGVRVLAAGMDVQRDEDLRGPSPGADFDQEGRLVASCHDGSVRLYDASMRPLARFVAQEGDIPHAVRFSPDGQRVAVGYRSGRRLDVLSGRDLSLLHRPDLQGAEAEGAGQVAWAPGDVLLHAAGARIRRFDRGGQGSHRDLPSALRVVDLAPLASGKIAFAEKGPAWGLLSPDGALLHREGRGVLDHDGTILSVDATGSRVRFTSPSAQKGAGRDQPATFFSVSEHVVGQSAFADSRFRRPLTSAPGLVITGWESGAQVMLNGRALGLRDQEVRRALAVGLQGQQVVIATDEALHAFDPSGKRLFRAPLAAPARAVNLSGDGRLIVAALADGTLRWYTASAGRELLALVLHRDRRRWVAFTPSGYYDASAAGDELAGWHVNRRPDQAADFFRLSRFREHFYRPDLIARLLFTLDEARALEEANAEAGYNQKKLSLQELLPPVVTILTPQEGAAVKTAVVRVEVAVRAPSGAPITQVRALVRGRMGQTRGIVVLRPDQLKSAPEAGEQRRTLDIAVPSEDSTVVVLAETAHAQSEPAILHLRWEGARAQRVVLTRDLRVLAVGVSEYREKRMQLDFPAKDARDLARAFQEQEGKLYRKVEVRVLQNGQATRQNVLEGLSWLRRETTPNDAAVFFIAGHGINDPSSGKYYFLPHDADLGEIEKTMVASQELQGALRSIPGSVVMFLDTCHSGGLFGPQSLRSATDLTRLTNELASVQGGVVVFAASTPGQVSRESHRWQNGVFTKAAVEGLRGRADYDQNGRITVTKLEHYISERVRELTHDEQTPTTAKPSTVTDFTLATVKVRYPLEKKWWFWSTLGVAIAGAGLGILFTQRPWEEKPQTFDLTSIFGDPGSAPMGHGSIPQALLRF